MASSIISTSIGKYMLQGWVLTDDVCETPGCNVPLMRSPRGRIPETYFCANCDGGPVGSSDHHPRASTTNDSSTSLAAHSDAHSSASSHQSRASTPPTDVTPPNAVEDLEDDDFVLPPVSEEMLARRAQSDFASAEIAKLMLQGWSMLADECPSEECWGVPLVKAPARLTNGEPSKKFCVVCKTNWIPDPSGRGLQTVNPPPSRSNPSQAAPVSQPVPATPSVITAHPPSRQVSVTEQDLLSPLAAEFSSKPDRQSTPLPAPFSHPSTSFAPIQPSTEPRFNSAPDSTTQALQFALSVLTQTLTSQSQEQPARPTKIAETARSISDVIDALEKANRVL